MKKLFPAVLALVVAGCAENDMSDLQRFVKEVKARKPTPIDPIPQIRQAETFLYKAANRRSPFVPSVTLAATPIEEETIGPRPDPNRRKEELEAFPLDSLRMVGTLEQKGVRWALIQTPDKTIHRLKKGNYLGQHDGKILSVEEDKIVILELIPNGRGGYRERQASLALGERA